MNVLHINESDLSGGAAIAGYRLHQGLLRAGVDSHILAGKVVAPDPRVAEIPARAWLDARLGRVTRWFGLNFIHGTGAFGIRRHPFYRDCDILHLHNLHMDRFTYLAIPALAKAKRTVFTLHDMWSFTGHCAYSYDSERWKTGCGQCPHLDVEPKVIRDNTRLEWKLKHSVYGRSKMVVVTPSRWLQRLAQESMLNRYPIHCIPYGIDTEIYRPGDQAAARAELGLPAGRNVVLLGAAKFKNTRKGADLAAAALDLLPPDLKASTIVAVLGEGGESIAASHGVETRNLGYLSDEKQKAVAYVAADIFLFPTRADNLPLMLQESLACGTPMVSFDTGGVGEIVRHGETGYLARPNDPADLARGIAELLGNPSARREMGRACRAAAEEEYTLGEQAARYMALYKEIGGEP